MISLRGRSVRWVVLFVSSRLARASVVVVPSCRCAVLYSGHVRSFTQPRVHLSHKENLIEQLEADCDVDVFMYLSVEDEVPMRYRMGKYADELSFTPFSPQKPAVDTAIRLLKPVAVEYHQEQAGFIPNKCEAKCEYNSYWQLYKMKAVYHMMEKHEASVGLGYTWIIRSRLDIGWMLPMIPLSRFSPSRAYVGHNFFPLADQFLLLPRRFAWDVFGTVGLCYDCDVLKAQVGSRVPAQTENLLRLTFRRAGVSFGYYEFPVVIVRSNEGGVCGVLHPYKITCQLLHASGLIDALPAAQGVSTALECAMVVNQWYRRVCLEMFPPLDNENTPEPFSQRREAENVKAVNYTGGIDHGASWGKKNGGFLADGVSRNDGSFDDEFARRRVVGPSFPSSRGDGSSEIGRREGHHRRIVDNGKISVQEAVERGSAVVSFDEATRRLKGISRDLNNLREAIRIHASPQQDPWPFIGAHHYPFHQVNGGVWDVISVIEGFRLSEVDFNRIALAFACVLRYNERNIAGEGIGHGTSANNRRNEDDRLFPGAGRHYGGGNSTGSSFEDLVEAGEGKPTPTRGSDSARDTLVLKTVVTSAGGEDVDAIVNCSLVDPLHDVWMTLMEKGFEPSEPICRGNSDPCLNKALAESME